MDSVKYLEDGYDVYHISFKEKWNIDWLFRFFKYVSVSLFVAAGMLSANALTGF